MTSENIGTRVGTLSDHDIFSLCSQEVLIAENYNKENVHQACYELRASNIYYDLADNNKKYTLKENEYILVKPKQLIVIITLETISLPADILGRILTKGKLFSIGLLPVNTYADPGFYGNLGIVFYNLSNNYLRISPKDAIAKIEFSKLMKPVLTPYRGQHGYQTNIWPMPEDMILSATEIAKDVRIQNPAEEISRSYGSGIGNIVNRVFRFERYLLLTGIAYLFFSMIIIYAMQGTDWITPTVGIILGVVSNIFTSLIIYIHKYRKKIMDIKMLMNIQKEFDSKHGWTLSTDESIKIIEMINKDLIGLFGEIGEFSNNIKKLNLKIERIKTSSDIDDAFNLSKDNLIEELIDSLIYILRIATHLDVNVEEAYLKKLQFNKVKYASFEEE